MVELRVVQMDMKLVEKTVGRKVMNLVEKPVAM